MAIEIERKFLLADDGWRPLVERSQRIAQGYLIDASVLRAGARASVRVRIADDVAWLNIKAAHIGIARAEFDYPIPLADGEAMLAELCDGAVEKVRHHVRVEGWLFEVDEFFAANAGLVVAEIELPSVDATFPRPAWLGVEVSALSRYYNVQLIEYPFSRWSADERAAIDAAGALP